MSLIDFVIMYVGF